MYKILLQIIIIIDIEPTYNNIVYIPLKITMYNTIE